MKSLEPATAIVGVGYTEYSRDSGRSTLRLALEASRAALRDSGLTRDDVDGVITYTLNDSDPSMAVATALGMNPTSVMMDWGDGGGNVACAVVGAADAFIRAGMAETVLVYRSMNGRSGHRFGGTNAPPVERGMSRATMTPAGWVAYPQMLAMWARRHMEMYGTRHEDYGAVAVKSREYAVDNERAQMRTPLSLDDYMASPMYYEPFRLNDMCLETDGACALIVTSLERARDLRKKPVSILSAAHGSYGTPGTDLAAVTPAVNMADNFLWGIKDRLFGRAGITIDDVDFAEIYDCFTSAVVAGVEGLGLAARGEGGAYLSDPGTMIRSADVPINTHGGLLSEGYLHGLNSVVEGVEQLRGESGARQVNNAEVGVVTAGAMTTGSALILGSS